MIPIFIALTCVNLLALATAAALGYARAAGRAGEIHMAIGAVATLACVAVHCIVFTYFIATAKWVQHAVDVKHLDAELVAPTRSFKAQAFPGALAAMAVVFATALLGAQADIYHGPWAAWHHAAALLALAVNVVVAAIEYRAVVRNGRLIDDVLAQIAAQ